MSRRKRLGVERLEDKVLLAGNVRVGLNGFVLSLVGDAADNQVAVYYDSGAVSGFPPGVYVADPADLEAPGTGTTLFNNGSPAGPQPGPLLITDAPLLAVNADLKNGDNTLSLWGLGVTGNVNLRTGSGDDQLQLGDVEDPAAPTGSATFAAGLTIGGNLNVRTGNAPAADQVTLSGVEGTAPRSVLSITTGNGDDQVAVQEPLTGNSLGSVEFHNLLVQTGAGDDTFLVDDLTGNSIVLNVDSLTVTTAGGSDSVALQDLRARIVRIQTGEGDDDVSLGDGFSGDDMRVSAGAGDDTVAVDSTATPLEKVDVVLGAGDDLLSVSGVEVNLLSFNGQSGTDAFVDGGGNQITSKKPKSIER